MATLLGTAEPIVDPCEVARRSPEAESSALVVVDIQQKLAPAIFEKERVFRNSELLIRMAKILNMPIVMATQNSKGLGGVVPEIASLLPEVTPFDKLTFGCFGNEAFCSGLKGLHGRNTLLLCGLESHICVTQTTLGALRAGYLVHVAADAVSSRTEFNWKIGLERMKAAGAVISSTEMMIYELFRNASLPGFKEMLKHLK